MLHLQRMRLITLVMGVAGSGKTYLLQRLPAEETMDIHRVTLAGIKEADIKEAKNIVLVTDMAYSGYMKDQLVKVAKELSEMGKHVYIHCRPSDWQWLKRVFE